MPSIYAHYRFGAAALDAMPGDIRRTAKRYRRVYDMGLHGPDIFFYYNPLWKTKSGALGSRLHKQTGKEFFGRICRRLRMEPLPETEAYLYGLLCHYTLDAACHPFVLEQAKLGTAGHIEIETEFDRFLLTQDGKCPPELQDLSVHMHLEGSEFEAVARCYPGVTARTVGVCLRHMVLANKVLAMPGEKKRELLKNGLGLAGQRYRGFVMTAQENPRCGMLNKPLLELYRGAEERFPGLLMQLNAHLTYNAPLGAEFSAIFG